MAILKILENATATGAGDVINIVAIKGHYNKPIPKTIHLEMTGTGAISATVKMEVSNSGDANSWLSDSSSTMIISGSNNVSDGVVLYAPWAFIRANVTAISGTAGSISVTLGVV